MENKRKNSGEEAERLRNAVQEASEKAKIASKEVRLIVSLKASLLNAKNFYN